MGPVGAARPCTWRVPSPGFPVSPVACRAERPGLHAFGKSQETCLGMGGVGVTVSPLWGPHDSFELVQCLDPRLPENVPSPEPRKGRRAFAAPQSPSQPGQGPGAGAGAGGGRPARNLHCEVTASLPAWSPACCSAPGPAPGGTMGRRSRAPQRDREGPRPVCGALLVP